LKRAAQQLDQQVRCVACIVVGFDQRARIERERAGGRIDLHICRPRYDIDRAGHKLRRRSVGVAVAAPSQPERAENDHGKQRDSDLAHVSGRLTGARPLRASWNG
jgi:hypothetical protein